MSSSGILYGCLIDVDCHQVLKQQYHVQCLLGLTATAAGDTILSLSRHLDIDSQSSAVMYRGGIPDNLELSVSCDSDKEKVCG